MVAKKKDDTFSIILWKDESGEDRSVAGPAYALADVEKNLKEAGTEYTITPVKMEEPIQFNLKDELETREAK